MGRQHHLSQRKSVESALAYIVREMDRHKNIHVETPVERLDEVAHALKSIGLETAHLENIKRQPHSKVNLLYRWDGEAYVSYIPEEGVGYGKITIQWRWVKEEGEEHE